MKNIKEKLGYNDTQDLLVLLFMLACYAGVYLLSLI